MFNPNDIDWNLTADDIRTEEERDAELESQYNAAVARYEATYVETEHCTPECSEYGAVAHSAACREAFAGSAREFNAIRAAERGEAPVPAHPTLAQREVFEPGLSWVKVPVAPVPVNPVTIAIGSWMRAAAPALPSRYAAIGNGLYVRTASRKGTRRSA